MRELPAAVVRFSLREVLGQIVGVGGIGLRKVALRGVFGTGRDAEGEEPIVGNVVALLT